MLQQTHAAGTSHCCRQRTVGVGGGGGSGGNTSGRLLLLLRCAAALYSFSWGPRAALGAAAWPARALLRPSTG